jgi:hypothetical protein
MATLTFYPQSGMLCDESGHAVAVIFEDDTCLGPVLADRNNRFEALEERSRMLRDALLMLRNQSAARASGCKFGRTATDEIVDAAIEATKGSI